MLSSEPIHKGPRYLRNCALARYIGVSTMSVWRWKRNPDLNVPPAAVINGVEYNDVTAWDAWLRSRAVSRIEHPKQKRERADH